MEPFLHCPHLAGTSKSKWFAHFIKNLYPKLGAAIMNDVAINYTLHELKVRDRNTSAVGMMFGDKPTNQSTSLAKLCLFHHKWQTTTK